jgi:hypothetical protein
MAQRDYEEQPEAPDLGASAQLESEEHLAAPAGDRDALDAGYSPPDRPYGAEEDGVTARGMREGDSLDERLRRERADEPADPDRAGRIAVAGEGAALETPDAMDAVDVGIDGGAAGAEEAAVHVVDDSGGGPAAEGSESVGGPAGRSGDTDNVGGDPEGGDFTGRGPDPARPRDPFETDPARREFPGERRDASVIDDDPESGGAAAGASGTRDVGPDAWR